MGLGARLAFVFACVAAATSLLVGGASYITTDVQVINEIDDFLRERVDEITDGQREDRGNRNGGRNNNNNDDDDDDDGAVDVPALDVFSPDAEVQFLDADGIVTSASGGVVLPVDSLDKELATRDDSSLLRTVAVDGTDYRMITSHIDGGGAVQVARSLDESVDLLSVLQTRLVVIALTLALLAGAVGWVVAQRTTRPLRALSSAVDEVAETRDFSVPVPASGRDEVGRLARGFNRMLDALQVSQMQQRRLVQDAAHELRTPLTSITANVDWLMRAPDIDTASQQETLGSVRRELRELNGVIAEIIELATDSREAPVLETTDLAAITNDAVEQFQRRSGRDVTVNARPGRVMGDIESLDRAITNLLSNADKYSPEGTSIMVDVGDGAVFVDDAGSGIAEADREFIFERFYRSDVDRSKPGSGLGLSIVARIIEQHGGTVTVGSSQALGGARIGFELPPI